MDKKIIITAVVTALVAGGLGYAAHLPVDAVALEAARQKGLDAGKKAEMQAINERFVEQGLSSPLDQPIKDVYGFVRNVGPDGFDLEYDSAQFTIVDTGKVTARVRVPASAKIERLVSQASAAPTMAKPGQPSGGAGQLNVPNAGNPSPEQFVPPEPTIRSTVAATLSELHDGDYVHVAAADNVRGASSMDATSVTAYDAGVSSGDEMNPSRLPFSRVNLQQLPFVPSPGTPFTPPPSTQPPGTPTVIDHPPAGEAATAPTSTGSQGGATGSGSIAPSPSAGSGGGGTAPLNENGPTPKK